MWNFFTSCFATRTSDCSVLTTEVMRSEEVHQIQRAIFSAQASGPACFYIQCV